jgi:DNA-binding MarR family transcriptional regulator
MSALALVGNYVLVAIPNVELGSGVLFVTAYLFGLGMGIWCVFIVSIIYAFFNPWGPFIPTIWITQLIGWIFMVIAGMLMGRKDSDKSWTRGMQIELAIVGAVVTLFFDLITTLGYSIWFGVPYFIAVITVWNIVTWKDNFIELSEPADGRVAPVFKSYHAAVALILIGREQPLGRYELCEKMSIGEGSVRTLLKRLSEASYIEAEGKQGQRLTSKGKKLFDSISHDVPLGLTLDIRRLVMYEFAFANLVKGFSSKITDGVRQRDEAIIQGGYDKAGATTLIQKSGSLVMPPDDFHILQEYEQETLLVIESLRPEDGDVIIIGSSDDENLAREVSMAAVMTLF